MEINSEKKSEAKHQKKKTDWEFYAQFGIIIVLSLILLYNYSGKTGNTVGIGTVSASEIIPTGVPAVYGEELGITYDDVSPNNAQKTEETINLLGNIDRIETLEGAELERYIDILYKQ